jgi:methionyl-tRNA formyltransferase
MIRNITYIGTSPVALEILCKHKGFKLASYLCERKRLTSRCQEIVSEYKINLLTFDTKEELFNQLDNLLILMDAFIMYQFDYILPYKHASTNKFFNFHSGSLRTNRGAHPIIRSILNGDKQTELTLHRINEKIDQGLIIGKYEVDIVSDDDSVSLKEKTEKGIIPLLEKLILYLNGEQEPITITEGRYFKPICEEDYKINIEFDTEKDIVNKIRSQKQYRGALVVIEGNRYYISSVKIINDLIHTNTVIINKDSIDIYRKDARFRLMLSNQL